MTRIWNLTEDHKADIRDAVEDYVAAREVFETGYTRDDWICEAFASIRGYVTNGCSLREVGRLLEIETQAYRFTREHMLGPTALGLNQSQG